MYKAQSDETVHRITTTTTLFPGKILPISIRMSNFRTKRIVIIGAGMSGLACAFCLKELGFNEVCILEAQDRIGGRLKTIKLGPHHIEMGAQWIHGQKNNIIYNIAKSKDLVDENAPSYIKTIEDCGFLPEETKKIVHLLIEYLYEKMESIDDETKVNVLNHMKEQFNKFKIAHQSYTDTLEAVFDWFCKFQCELNGCCSLEVLSKTSLCAYKECDGHQTVELQQGYQSILDVFLQNIPQNWILKNSHVTKIDWSGDEGVMVFCENGKEYLAHHVVVTVPLGYLKEYSQSLFYPSLSEKKLNVISCLGFGVVNKVFLNFEIPFWDECTVINVLWDKKLKEYFNNSTQTGEWIKDINRFAYTLHHPNMLCAWVVGKGAVSVEYLSDEKVIEDCLFLLEYIFERELSSPSNILRSSWSKDPYTLGSYSYVSTNCDSKNISHKDIADPEYSHGTPVLLFAGEASHEYYFSTVHGACESGFREAKRLFQYYRNLDNHLHFDEINSISSEMANLLSLKGREEVKIVIIGAGIAGLACGSYLTKNHFTDVLILEAQNRIGGRINSIKHGNGFLELGAQWIHGSHNELYKFAKENRILPSVLDTSSCEGKGVFYTSSGNIVDSLLVDEVKTVLDDVKSMLEKADSYEKISVLSAFSDAFDSYLTTINDQSRIPLLKGLYDWYIRFELIDNACESLETIASQSYADWDDCDPDVYHIMTEKGFSSIIDALATFMPKSNLILNKPVKTLTWQPDFKQKKFSDEKPVLIECDDGETFSADCVIVTASLGFLKENCHSFFNPSLPYNKCDALNRFGFGVINKFYLVYEKAFWHPDDLGIQLVWDENLNEENQKLLNENPWVRGITGFDIDKKLPNVLLGWIGGKEAKLSEEISDDDICLISTKLLKIFCNQSDLPSPLKVYRSKWYQNPYVRGAYSNRTLSYYEFESTLHDLQYPLCSTYTANTGLKLQWPIIMFAGEALDVHAFSSAHGAYQSGLRTAESVIKAFSQIQASEIF
ncbi:uncharacterized protein [Parasteatoda tepidariorum]|uniref:uncharacterized protein isoform X1 n=1 Tax=Parasteatoda tepidariorum TaxID=114398 RepID=UPI001C721BC8|nr:uncharacterized protein LOC107453502 [Parasteatoda tepidariorum]